MGIERVSHYIDNVLTEAQARMGLRDTRLLVTWYTNRENRQSVVHSHPYHELVLPIGGSTVRYSVDGSVYLVHVGSWSTSPLRSITPAASVLTMRSRIVWSFRSMMPYGRLPADTRT